MRAKRQLRIGLLLLTGFALACGWRVYVTFRHEQDNVALIAAVKRTHLAEVKELLARDADPNTHTSPDSPHSISQYLRVLWDEMLGKKQRAGPTAFALSFQSQEKDQYAGIAISKALLLHGAEPNVLCRDYTDEPCIFTALSDSFYSSLYSAEPKRIDPELVRLMVNKGVNLRTKDSSGETLLDGAFGSGDADVVRLLLTRMRKAGIPCVVNYDESPLRAAADAANPGILQAVLDQGVDINQVEKDGYTALTWEIVQTPGQPNPFTDASKAVGVLLAHGADPNIKTRDGRTALMIASDFERSHDPYWKKVAQILKRAGAKE